MIVRLILVFFASATGAICYLAGLIRLMSALLVAFGGVISLFFGVLFLLPDASRELWIPVYGSVMTWPFFLIALLLFGVTSLFFIKRKEENSETYSSWHLQNGIGGVCCLLLSIFLPAILWFPSEEKKQSLDPSTLEIYMYGGTGLYLLGTAVALLLLYRASKGGTEKKPDLMRRSVLAFFACFQMDKLPAFIAFLLIYSPDTGLIYPGPAALALAGYIPVSLFLLKLSWQSTEIEA